MARLLLYGLWAKELQSKTHRRLPHRQRQLHWKLISQSFFSQASTFKKQPSTDGRRRPTRRASRKLRRTYDDQISGKPTNSVFNISSYTLSPLELSVLQKGLSFCPTPPWDKFQLSQDLQNFFRKIRLKTHFGLEPVTPGNRAPPIGGNPIPDLSISSLGLRNPSNFSPPHTFHAVEAFIDVVQKDIEYILAEHEKGLLPTHSNITPIERQAIDSLKNNKSIIIKPADKGGAIVIQNFSDYMDEISRQLSDSSTYQKISRDPTPRIKLLIDEVLDRYLTLKTIDSKTVTFLKNSNPVIPVFYTLPKIHKSLLKPPGRPIVASTDSIFSPISTFLEKILTPLTKTTKSFVLDTGHFLSFIRQIDNIPPECLLVTLDFQSLYTSIDHDLGISATKTLLESSDLSHNSIHLCIDLLSIILKENFFLFGDQFYLQCRGTAMGANVAPAYANAYMNDFECSYVYNNTLFKTYSQCWLRYIDNIFCLWLGTLEDLLSFTEHLNSIRPELQFTLNCNSSQISFLDTLVIKSCTGTLSTDLYVKPTDSNNLLHYTSCHPASTKDSLPRSQFTRVTRIVTDPTLAPIRLNEMSDKFKVRHYPTKLLESETRRALEPCPLQPSQPKGECVTFVHTHHPVMPKIYHIIHKHWSILPRSYPHIEAFKTPALMCKRRPRNIRDELVRADIGSLTRTPRQTFLGTERKGTFPCLGCACCSNVIKGSDITHPRTGKRYGIRGFFTCDTNYVVYLIKCPCGLLYVGESTQHVRDRISSHKSTIRCKKTWLPIPYHFINANHSVSQLRFQVIEKVERPRRGGDHIKLLKSRESFWIYRSQTLAPKGLNRELDLSPH
ncbi:uncharacterized protein [Dendrobates tinctorius]|uniref:uncharacterized protein n=1 Tax=Dendrobates tinctorius TaxID=92724 RepID=UPI003CC976EE